MITRISALAAAAVCVASIASLAACGGKKPAVQPNAQAGDAGALPEELTSRKILHRKDLVEIPGKESVVTAATIPKGGASGKHFHPGPELAYVLQGQVTLFKEGEEPRVVNAGETFSTTAKKAHDVKNTGDVPAKLIVFMVFDKGESMSTPVKD